MEKLRWGILGTGNIAGTLANAIKASGTGRLTAVGSRTRESAEAFGEKYDIPNRHDSYDAVLDDPAVDAVYISLPNHLHAEWTIRAARAGRHILCEKPFAVDAAQAQKALAAVEEAGVFFMEAFMYRCAEQTARVAQIVRDGALGEIRLIQAAFGYHLGPKYDNIRMRGDVAGGSIMDVGCYTLSMARLIAGAAMGAQFAEPIEIKACAHIGRTSQVDEWAVAAMRFPGDILANLACGSQVAMDPTLQIRGSQGYLVVPNPWFPGRAADSSTTIRLHREGSNPEEIEILAGAALYSNQVDIVARHLTEKEAPSPCMTRADTLANQRALDRWRQEAGVVFPDEVLG